jgi:hypothetical protein
MPATKDPRCALQALLKGKKARTVKPYEELFPQHCPGVEIWPRDKPLVKMRDFLAGGYGKRRAEYAPRSFRG